MNGDLYWVWLQCALGAGIKTADILNKFDDAWQIYKSNELQRRASRAFTPRQLEKLAATDINKAKTVCEICRKNGWQIVTPESEFYPPNMRKMRDMPLVLYVSGDVSVLSETVAIGMVGTREASGYARRAAFSMAAALAEAGALVVSGGALGVDSACHEGAIAGKGKTLAFLGCGLGAKYLMENEALRHEISKNGAVVSEFLPLSGASRVTFPIRNRLISGMSLGTVVIEAGEKSGSLITARLASEQGRDVFAVPGSVISSAYSGTNKLIRDGAQPVFTAADILSDYAAVYPGKIKLDGADKPLYEYREMAASYNQHLNNSAKSYTIKGKDKNTREETISEQKEAPAPERDVSSASENARLIYKALAGGAKTPDELSSETGLPYHITAAALTELELFGAAECISGGRYRRK